MTPELPGEKKLDGVPEAAGRSQKKRVSRRDYTGPADSFYGVWTPNSGGSRAGSLTM